MMNTATPVQTNPATAAMAANGILRGTEVMTLAGIRPVESLHEGDRIVTRTGARALRSVLRNGGESFRLMFDKPQVVYLAEGQVYGETGLPFAA